MLNNKILPLLFILVGIAAGQIINPGGGSGSVSSAGLSVNSGSSSGIFAVTGSPVTTSGTLNINLSGTTGFFTYFSSSTVLAKNANLDDGATNANGLTYVGTAGVFAASYTGTGSNGGYQGTEGTGANVSFGSGKSGFFPDSTNHCLNANYNNTGIGCLVAGGTAAVTSGDLASYNGTTGFRIQDSSVVAANVVVASAPGAGLCHFAGSTQTCTSSAVVNADITSMAESKLTGSAAATTVTEAGTGDAVSRVGVETGNLTAPYVFTNGNSTNSNTSIGAIFGATGSSTGGIGALFFDASGTGDIARFYTGGSVAAGVYTAGTLEASITNAGVLNLVGGVTVTTPGTGAYSFGTDGTEPASIAAGASGFVDDSTANCPVQWNNATNVGCSAAYGAANAFTAANTFSSTVGVAGPLQSNAANTALTITGGINAATTGASGTLTAGGENVNGGSTASMVGGAATFQGGDNASSGATETAGAVTLRGGDTTNASAAVQTTGAVTIRGGNNTATGAAATLGTVTITGGTQSGAATNSPGADVTISGGLGTGNSTPAHVKLRAPSFSNTSGSTAQAQATTYVVHKKSGSTTSATATNMFNIAVTTNQTIGVEVIVHVETTQATPQNCSTTENFIASVQNTSSTITQQTTAGTIGTICSTGTLTLAAAFSAATPSVFSVTPTWTTIVPTGVIITIEVHNLSQQDITLL